MSPRSGGRQSRPTREDPRDTVPACAWLLVGDGASFQELAPAEADAKSKAPNILWTAAKQTAVGDLVLIYFIGERKAAHFIARAASDAFRSSDIPVNATTKVSSQQWWVHLTPPVPIAPVAFSTIRDAVGAHLILRGRSGKFLPPDAVDALRVDAAKAADRTEVARIWRRPSGIAGLPASGQVTMDLWRALAAGAFPLEAHVSSHLVLPLLRHVLGGTDLVPQPEFRVGRGFLDFAVLGPSGPVAAVEVKLAIDAPAAGSWERSPDYQQLRRYMEALDVPGLLIDAKRVVLFSRTSAQPRRTVTRRHATTTDLKKIRRHITG